MVALGASLLVLVSACGTGGGTPTPSGAASTAPATSAATSAATLASTFIFGGPPECPNRPFCLIGLKDTYGLEFKEFKPLDVGGPITVAALEKDEIQVALLFTSDPTIGAKGFIELEDDQKLQRADNLVAVVNKEAIDANPEIAMLLNPVSAAITQEELIALNKRIGIDKEDADAVAGEWLTSKNLLSGSPQAGSKGPIAVGKTNFYEQDVLSEIYAQVLEHNGFKVDRKEASGNREAVFPALESGEIDLLPEYLATALEYVNGGAGQATADATETAELFRTAAAARGLSVLDPAPATDQNTIVVTKATADRYGLTKVSDLAKPAP
jgi:osmoprotectant transport system substrate-binding protein